MKYMGSKSRIAKSIVPIIQAEIDRTGWNYWEPFCGGCNVIDKIKANKRYASDNNKYLIALWKYLQIGEKMPKELTKQQYSFVRSDPDHFEDWMVGCVGFIASYNGKWMGGYAGKTNTKIGTVRDYYDEARRNVESQSQLLKDVIFSNSSYLMHKPHNLVIYCDPPYANTTGYKCGGFDSELFWNTVREWSKDNIVLVSEETSPDDFEVIWQQEILRTQDNKTRKMATEKLFKLK